MSDEVTVNDRAGCHLVPRLSPNIHEMAQPQVMVQSPPDPLLQAVIDADFKPINLKLGGPDGNFVLSGGNSEEADEESGLDFTRLNKLTKLLGTNPNLRCPPPPTVISQKLSQVINGTKEEGNVCLSVLRWHVTNAKRFCTAFRPCLNSKSTSWLSSDTPWQPALPFSDPCGSRIRS